MSRKIVVNSTPLIALAKCGKLEILKSLFGEIIIPEAVYREVCAKPDKVAEDVKEACGWIHVQTVNNIDGKQMYSARLHDGEVEVMILAQEIKADLVLIDDYAARNTAKYLKLPLAGTLGVLLAAKDEGIIHSVSEIIDEMESNNIYYSKELKEVIKKRAGE